MAIARAYLFALVGLLLSAAPAYSQAVLLFDNGYMNFLDSYEMTEWIVADDFEVIFSAQATRGTFGMGDTTCTFPANWDGHLRWWIFNDNGGLPGSYVASGYAPEVSANKVFDNCPDTAWYSVQFKFGQMVPLSSGVRYWLAIHMATDWSARSDLYWATTSPGNYASAVTNHLGTGPWVTVGLEHSFSIMLVGDDDYLFVDGFESKDTSIWSMTVP